MGANTSTSLVGDGKCSSGAHTNQAGHGRLAARAEARAASHGDQLVGSHASRERKKKGMTGFATLRKKLIRRRRASKSFDHGKIIRDFVADWSPAELNTLVEEYEATAALKDLSVQADLARPPASTFKQDLGDLLDYKYASDVTLVFQGACFPAHRAILSSRCSYFRELLNHPSSACRLVDRRLQESSAPDRTPPQVHVDSLLQSRGIDVPTFAALLRYLYTGDFCLDGDSTADASVGSQSVDHMQLLIRLGQDFGTPNALELDLRYLMETGDLADAVLVFASGQDFPTSLPAPGVGKPSPSIGPSSSSSTGSGGSSSNTPASDYGFFPWLEIPCHRAVLSARSPFFRSLIHRRLRSETMSVTPIKIILDESVIPRRYARVLMQALYLDTIDMNCIVRSQPQSQQPNQQQPAQQLQCQSQLQSTEETVTCTNVQVVAGCSSNQAGSVSPRSTAAPTLFEEATELYQIGRFLDLDILSQGCEDVLVDNLCLDNLPQVLRWSELPHGSAWVRRQAIQLLREEFSAVAQAPVLFELDKSHLVEALQSDFLQASELEVLQAVLRWGEHQLVRRMEEREPNIVSQTAHSVARKGIRRRDLNDVELRDILSELLPHVRVDHVLPPSHDCLSQAIRRGLVSTPPSHMIGGDKVAGAERGEQLRLHAWIRGKNQGLYVKPRLFMPYFEESKALLADQLGHETDLVRLRMVRASSAHIPDTLYMIDDASMAGAGASQGHEEDEETAAHHGAANDLDVVTGSVVVPDSETMQAMIRRERKLRSSAVSQRAYSLPLSSRRDVNAQIRLRVVREFNLPDSIAEELEMAAYQFAEEEAEEQQQQLMQQQSVWEQRMSAAASAPVRIAVASKKASIAARSRRPLRKPPHHASDDNVFDDGDDADADLRLHHRSQLSEFIPDIAALSIGSGGGGGGSGHHHHHLSPHLNLPPFIGPLQPPEPYRELQLDLGDGTGLGRGVEWSIVRPNHAVPPVGPPPVRMSTFRSTDDQDAHHHWEATLPHHHAQPQQPPPPERLLSAATSTSQSNLSPRSQRARSRSSRAADVRVFI